MEPKSTDDGMTKFENVSFSVLVKPAQERRMAADWEYYSRMASEIFNDSMALAGEEGLGKSFWPSGVVAIAIDPLMHLLFSLLAQLNISSGV